MKTILRDYRVAWVMGAVAFLLTGVGAMHPTSTSFISGMAQSIVEGLWVGVIWTAIGGVITFIVRRLMRHGVNIQLLVAEGVSAVNESLDRFLDEVQTQLGQLGQRVMRVETSGGSPR